MRKKSSFILTGILFFFTVTCFGQVKLPKLVSHGMVLLRDTEVKIWGWTSPNEKVQVPRWFAR